MFQICGGVEAGGFPVQNVYKMTYGDKNATFEPLNPWTVTHLWMDTSSLSWTQCWKKLTIFPVIVKSIVIFIYVVS